MVWEPAAGEKIQILSISLSKQSVSRVDENAHEARENFRFCSFDTKASWMN